MNDKRYYFLSGFPRSGNTLVSSILNQNPDICVYGNSILSEIFLDIEFKKHHNQLVLNFPDTRCLENISHKLFENYYSHINCKYIIDRSCWTTEQHSAILKKYCPNNIRIIFLYRDIIEILASFIKWSSENKTFLDNFKTLEEKCDYLMSRDGPIMKHYISIQNLINQKNDLPCMFISYNEIVSDTKNVIQKIYSFFNIEFFQHNLEKIEQYSVNGVYYDDSIIGDNLHRLRNTIKKDNYDVREYLTEEIISFYKNLNITVI